MQKWCNVPHSNVASYLRGNSFANFAKSASICEHWATVMRQSVESIRCPHAKASMVIIIANTVWRDSTCSQDGSVSSVDFVVI